MSVHFINTTMAGRKPNRRIPVQVCLGWDRRLGHFHFSVMAPRQGPVMSNLEQANAFGLRPDDIEPSLKSDPQLSKPSKPCVGALDKPWDPTPRIGGKNGSKRHLLVDGRGVPLSLVVTGANVHDSKGLKQVLTAIVVKRPIPDKRRSKHLCADAGYRGANLLETMERHGYIAHVVSRKQEAKAKRRRPERKARRWVVEVCHSWFNRFRKLLVRYEKLDRSFTALNHLAAAIIAFRKVPLAVNIIYG